MDITTTVQQRTTAHENNENADNRTGHTGRFRRGIFDETQSLPPPEVPGSPGGRKRCADAAGLSVFISRAQCGTCR